MKKFSLSRIHPFSPCAIRAVTRKHSYRTMNTQQPNFDFIAVFCCLPFNPFQIIRLLFIKSFSSSPGLDCLSTTRKIPSNGFVLYAFARRHLNGVKWLFVFLLLDKALLRNDSNETTDGNAIRVEGKQKASVVVGWLSSLEFKDVI